MKQIIFIAFIIALTMSLGCNEQLKGNAGEAGAKGLDGSTITTVQFCPGLSSYPSTFPEVGLCISNKLYGVFWISNSAFMAEIPTGNYVSTSTSLPCSFKVTTSCNISY